MCGIVGYIGQDVTPSLLIDALKRLEYRGYDSAGIAMQTKEGLVITKAQGEIKVLEQILEESELIGSLGIAHTRWATHGVPSDVNAHPHWDCSGRIALVHNGIIENYQHLKDELISRGHTFRSETDTEVIVHLIEEQYELLKKQNQDTAHPDANTTDSWSHNNLESKNNPEHDDLFFHAVRNVIPELEGAYAMVVVSQDADYIVGVREKSPLVIGQGSGENYLASDVSALLKYTSEFIYLNDGEIVKLTKHDFQIKDRNGINVEPRIHQVEWTAEDAQKGGFEHFMLKEIHEQVEAIQNTFIGMSGTNIGLDYRMKMLQNIFRNVRSVEIIACGTSYHAGLIGKYFIESVTGIPVEVVQGSEYRYSSPVDKNPLVIGVSQSGETADTLAGIQEAKKRGFITVAITNVVGSTITRDADFTLFTRTGPEVGVAATKTYTSQIMVLYFVGLRIFQARREDPTLFSTYETALRKVPRLIQRVIEDSDKIKQVAKFLSKAQSIFFIGRNINYPTIMEGALKLKEISYIHAEAYPAGELKHGPLALLSPETPVVAATASDHVRTKVYSNIGEVCARKAPVIIIAEEGDEMPYIYTDKVLTYPPCLPQLSPFPITVLLQLLAYYTAKERGCPIDKPRNLAKSVTVE